MKRGFPGGSVVKNVPAMQEMQETWVLSLGQTDTLEEGMATYTSILARKIPWTKEPWQAMVHGVTRSWTQLSTQDHGEMSGLITSN